MSAAQIVGAWLDGKPAERQRVLSRLAKSESLWERRIAVLATFYYIKKGEYGETLRIAQLLLKDEEDLIQKAVGWMLREVGKRVGEDKEESFLKRYYRQMPRTMLRYAIERFAEPKRKRYLMGLI
jgi:3-methyladenine DNA glycosylase AlkD